MVHARSLQMNPDIWHGSGQSPADEFCAHRFLDDEDGEETRMEEKTEAERDYDRMKKSESPSTVSEPIILRKGTTPKQKKQRMLSLRGGQNLCPGRHLAMNEILGGFAILMRKLYIEIVEEAFKRTGMPRVELWDGKRGALWPDRELRVRMRRRRGV